MYTYVTLCNHIHLDLHVYSPWIHRGFTFFGPLVHGRRPGKIAVPDHGNGKPMGKAMETCRNDGWQSIWRFHCQFGLNIQHHSTISLHTNSDIEIRSDQGTAQSPGRRIPFTITMHHASMHLYLLISLGIGCKYMQVSRFQNRFSTPRSKYQLWGTMEGRDGMSHACHIFETHFDGC